MKNHAVVRSSDERTEIAPGFNNISVHPVNQKEVPLVIIGLGQAVPDQFVFKYLQQFRLRNVNNTAERLKAIGGMWKDQRNGDRRIIVDVSPKSCPWELTISYGIKKSG